MNSIHIHKSLTILLHAAVITAVLSSLNFSTQNGNNLQPGTTKLIQPRGAIATKIL